MDVLGAARGPRRRLEIARGGQVGGSRTNLVMGFDLSPVSQCALEVAADLSRRLDAHLHVVHAVDLSDYPIDPDGPDWEEQARRTLTAERLAVAAGLSEFDRPWSYHAWHGIPGRLLAEVADESDALMIVIGARGSGVGAGISHLLARSVGAELVGRRGHRPVLVVPPGAARPS